MNGPIEILAPAGSPEALTAAVRCGAAAVYCGMGPFNARRSAQNFSPETLREAVAYCHARGVKLHLALNTLLRQDELDAAIKTAEFACELGVDALIVQDTGLARLLRAAAPAMPLHASTQLSCHTPAGVELLRDAGFSRVVLAREMTREELAACAGLGVELEVFVHGALCMSVSGQCYFSAMLGGRSGNRGTCAQTCRLPFGPTGSPPRPCPPEAAALSLRDNCLLAYVSELSSLGVTSLKIEGRMKRPEYVAAASAVYSAAARGETVGPEALARLRDVFSRSGFTDGYYTGRRGSTMFGTRRREDVTAAAGVLGSWQRLYDREQPLVPVTMELTVRRDEARLTAADTEGHTAAVRTGDGITEAEHRPLEDARAREQLRKTGGTPFYAAAVHTAIQPGLTMPAAGLNALRRQALEELLRQRSQTRPVPFDPTARPASLSPVPAAERPRRVLRLADAGRWSPALHAALVLLPLSAPAEVIRRIRDSGQAVGVDIPRGMFGRQTAVAAALQQAAAAGAVAALCGNVGALRPALDAGLTPIGSFGLNLTNREALAFYREQGLAAATLSMELTFPQMRALLPAPLPVGLLVYGRQPLMLTRNCPRRCAAGDCRGCTGQGITDRTGAVFPVQCAGGCAEVLNSVPLYFGDHPEELPAADFHLFHFTTEDTAEMLRVLEAYDRQAAASGPITRGLYRRGVL